MDKLVISIWWEQVSWGGVDSHLLELLSNWPNQNDEFIVFVNRDNDGVNRIQAKLGLIKNVKVSSLNYTLSGKNKIFRYIFLPLFMVFYVLRSFFILRKNPKIDVLICDQGGFPASWSGLSSLIAARILGVKTRILLVHHCAIARKIFRFTCESIIDLLVQYCSTDIVAVSLATRKSLIDKRDFDVEKFPIRVIHNGINLRQLEEATKYPPGWLRAQLDLIDDEILLCGIVGRAERYKGHEDFILALSSLKKDYSQRVKLIIAGRIEVKDQNRLQLLAQSLGVENNLHFLGFFQDDIRYLLKEFDVLLMLTKDFEGFGLTIAESMSIGVPALVTNVGAISEYLDNSVAYVIEPESPDQIKDFLIHAISKNYDLKFKGLAAINRAQKFGSQRMAANFHQLIISSRC